VTARRLPVCDQEKAKRHHLTGVISPVFSAQFHEYTVGPERPRELAPRLGGSLWVGDGSGQRNVG
jgi:hypothetical protein